MNQDCFHVKLSDFGLTQGIGTLVPSIHEALVLRPCMDTWAFRVLLFIAFTGYFPWEREVEDLRLFQEFIYWQHFENYTAPPRILDQIFRECS
ncbi:unnamed protein product [Ranitomeya imitator]|uniref:Protein kinase domain-containing protein n=1 Tax=Ranitomeya imitator TaxID=111125 RepID=A0ABN9LMU5_9NEOB|nr:unnamed protein product [Ranitomeya imitator]